MNFGTLDTTVSRPSIQNLGSGPLSSCVSTGKPGALQTTQHTRQSVIILRAIIDHAKYLGQELWLTFYDIEKCFGSLWLKDCINSL